MVVVRDETEQPKTLTRDLLIQPVGLRRRDAEE